VTDSLIFKGASVWDSISRYSYSFIKNPLKKRRPFRVGFKKLPDRFNLGFLYSAPRFSLMHFLYCRQRTRPTIECVLSSNSP